MRIPKPCPSVCVSVRLSAPRQYQSYISNWYINGKVFTSTTPWKHKILIFFFFQKSLKFEFWLMTKSWNHLSFVNISPTLVIDTSMERSSRILHHGNPKFFYASPTSWEAYRDRRLTTNFELWVEIFCVSTCFHVRIPKPCLSVRPSVCPSVCPSAPREKKSS